MSRIKCAVFAAWLLTASFVSAGDGEVVAYAVPALSNTIRLPDRHPDDGVAGGSVDLVAARGEYESGSFILRAARDFANVTLAAGDLSGPGGARVPATAIDLKVVKVWAQAGTAWYSFFADPAGRALIPELLLNDENLVRVDHETLENYLRVTYPDGATEYAWIGEPPQAKTKFNVQAVDVRDAESLRPFALAAGAFKQFWLTVAVPEDEALPEGVYAGEIAVAANGRTLALVPLRLRVLPFSLPAPKTHYDPERVFYASAYNDADLWKYTQDNGGDLEKAAARLARVYADFRRHNLMYPMVEPVRDLTGKKKTPELLRRQLEIYRDAGLAADTIFDALNGVPPYTYLNAPGRDAPPMDGHELPENWAEITVGLLPIFDEVFGTRPEIYALGWDEPSARFVRGQRPAWKLLHRHGVGICSTGKDAHLLSGGFNQDFINYGGHFDRRAADRWHAMGARITAYANPHTGPENPDYVRRTHGLAMYLDRADGTNNYMLSYGYDQWSDFAGAANNYRSFTMLYPTTDGHVGTLEWEGFREAIDDVRYATLLVRTANAALASGDVDRLYHGRAALSWLAEIDARRADLAAVRLEMIARILRLGALAAAGPGKSVVPAGD